MLIAGNDRQAGIPQLFGYLGPVGSPRLHPHRALLAVQVGCQIRRDQVV